MDIWFWLVMLVLLLVVEAVTLSLTTIWFACGALVALILSLFCDKPVVEGIVFLVISLLLLLTLRPSALRRFNNRRARTNADSVLGRTVLVKTKVDYESNTGRVTIGGMEWAARSLSEHMSFAPGSKATVDHIEGVKLIIKPKED